MKHAVKTGLITLLLTAAPVFALNPVQGFYGGLILGANYTPSIQFNFTHPVTHEYTTGTLNYSYLGNIGIQIGKRFCYRYRAEGELFFNNSPYGNIQVGNTILKSSDSDDDTGLTFNGYTNTLGIMLNGYFDFLTANGRSNLVPYVGAGVGYAFVQNKIEFQLDGEDIKQIFPAQNVNGAAAQGIVGLSYFMDDFTTFSIDGRYFRTFENTQFLKTFTEFYTLNFSFNGAFDFG